MTQIRSGARIERILLATDFSRVAEVASDYAVALARHYSSTLEGVHVVDLSSADPTLDVLTEPALETLRHSGEEGLERLAQTISGITFTTKMIEGRPPAVLVREAVDVNADLIVLGTSSKHGLKKLALGSTAEEVIREATCPVLTIGPHVSKPADGPLSFRRIVFATDFSTQAEKAAALALSFAKDGGAKIYLCHVVNNRNISDDAPRDAVAKMAFQKLMNDSHSECVVEHGKAADAILGLAMDASADLIILGARKETFWRTYIMTGVTPALLAEAECPVLSVC
jgi:nucleotide-binding universal stress UspA family protein